MPVYLEIATQRYPVALDEVRSSSPVLFGEQPPAELLAAMGIAVVQPTTAPQYDASAFRLEEAQPVLVDGVYRQSWRLVPIPVVVPLSVTSTQGKLALLDAGLYGQVLAEVASSDPRVSIWFNTQTWERNNANVEAIGKQLALTEAQIDALFVTASKIVD